MRPCDEIVELISASLDGELSAEEQTALDEHIACCPACSALLDDLRVLHTAAAELEEVPAPAGFAASVMAAVAAEAAEKKADNVIPFPAKKAKRTHWKPWTVSAAAIAIVVLGAVSAPSLMGNFGAKNAAMDMDMSYVRDSAPAEYQMETAAEDSMYYSVETESKGKSNLECGFAEPAPSTEETADPGAAPQDPAEISTTSKAPETDHVTGDPTPSEAPETDVERYAGILLLEGSLDMLEQYEGAACSDGTVTYIVSADVFAEVFSLLEAEKPVGYGYTAGNPSAELGKIVVQSN